MRTRPKAVRGEHSKPGAGSRAQKYDQCRIDTRGSEEEFLLPDLSSINPIGGVCFPNAMRHA